MDCNDLREVLQPSGKYADFHSSCGKFKTNNVLPPAVLQSSIVDQLCIYYHDQNNMFLNQLQFVIILFSVNFI